MAEIKNLKKAAKRILKAIKSKENIILYGDADLDGAASVIILKETIQSLGGKISAVYFPDREKEGYGITEAGLNYLKNFSPALLITLDIGISSFKEAILAKKMGFELIIVDHHEILDKVPEAEIVVDPKQKNDKYPFKSFAAAGIAFKLSEALLKDKTTDNLKKNFLELVALATIADMMPQESENKIFISEGLQSLKKTWRPGIKVFFETKEFENFPEVSQKVYKIISVLNVRDVKYRMPACFRVLTVSSLPEAKKIVKTLLAKNEKRKEKIKATTQDVEKMMSEEGEEAIVFEGGSKFDLSLLSAVASIICHQYKKPTFLFKKMAKESQGTVRTPSDTNSVVLMQKCKKLLLTYGGHPHASGFRIKNENLEKFKKCLIRNFKP